MQISYRRRLITAISAVAIALSATVHPTPAQGVPVEPTATPNADLAPMPLQGTPVEPTATAIALPTVPSGQGVPLEPTATPISGLAVMPLQGTPIAATVTSTASPLTPTSESPKAAPTPEYAPGVVLVGVMSAAARGAASPIDQVLTQLGGASAAKLYTMTVDGVAARGETPPITEVYRVSLPAETAVLTAVEALKGSGVVFAEPDYLARAIPVERGQGLGAGPEHQISAYS